jgi:hypothetical protein
MIATKPQPVNFEKLTNDCKTIIGNLNLLAELLQRDIDMLKQKKQLTNEERKQLAFLLIELTKTKQELEAKQLVYNEYILRCKERQAVEKTEKEDYLICKGIVLKKAYEYRDNEKVLPELRKHLKEVLKQPQQNFNLDQNIAYHLALKKEVTLCENYLESLKNE